MSPAVNEAIEKAHRQGILTAASLMVGADAAADAIDRAGRLPTLRVGLHLVLVDGSPVSPIETIPGLVDSQGKFSSHLVTAGIRFFLSPKVRRQLETEIRAQFQAFQKTGLPLDHVNAHHHMHLHPIVLRALLKVGKDYGIRAVRLPYEPPILSWRASRKALLLRILAWLFLFPWLMVLKIRLRKAKVRSSDIIFGLYDDGHMDLNLVLRFLRDLPQGVTEIYFHPATDIVLRDNLVLREGQRQREFEILVNPVIRHALQDCGIQTIAFGDL